jgi:hypothetical protein
VLDVLGIHHVEITFTEAQIMNGLEDIRLPNSIRSSDAVYPSLEMESAFRMVLETIELYLLEVEVHVDGLNEGKGYG